MRSYTTKFAILAATCLIPVYSMARVTPITNYNFEKQTAEVKASVGSCESLNNTFRKNELKGDQTWSSCDYKNGKTGDGASCEQRSSWKCTRQTIAELNNKVCFRCEEGCSAAGAADCSKTGLKGDQVLCKSSSGTTYYKTCKCDESYSYYAEEKYNMDTSYFNFPTAVTWSSNYGSGKCYNYNDVSCKSGYSESALEYIQSSSSYFSYTYKTMLKSSAYSGMPDSQVYLCAKSYECQGNSNKNKYESGKCVISTAHTESNVISGATCYTYSCSTADNCYGTTSSSPYFNLSKIASSVPGAGNCYKITGCTEWVNTDDNILTHSSTGNSIYGKSMHKALTQGIGVSINVTSTATYDSTYCYKATCAGGYNQAWGGMGSPNVTAEIKATYQNISYVTSESGNYLICAKDPVPQTCPTNQCDITCGLSGSWLRYFME